MEVARRVAVEAVTTAATAATRVVGPRAVATEEAVMAAGALAVDMEAGTAVGQGSAPSRQIRRREGCAQCRAPSRSH